MKTITLTKKQLRAQGRFGMYFRISQRQGVKILKKTGRKTLPDTKSPIVQKIIQEASIGILAQGVTKKLILVKYQNLYYVGILQKHVVTVSKGRIPFNLNRMKKDLLKLQVVHGDMAERNLLPTKKGYVLIDFDPSRSYFVGEKTRYYAVKNRLIKDLKTNYYNVR